MFAVLWPDGALKLADMKQCLSERWVPVAVLRVGGVVTLFCFRDSQDARKFAKRNLPREWVCGVIRLSELELDWVNRQGWRLEVQAFPRLVKDQEGFGYEVLEFQTNPELYVV